MEQLRTKRGFVRRAITKAISTIDALLSDEATPVRVLHHHLELVLAKQAELVEFDRTIQDTLTDAELKADRTTAFECEQQVSFTKASVRLATEPRPPVIPGLTAQLASPLYPAAPSAAPGVSPAASFSRVALPNVHIPTFSGERRDWQGFWDQYQASIHGNGSLSKIDKFKYLLTYLSGSAKTAFQGIRLRCRHQGDIVMVMNQHV
ncbi:hypothetical protein HPB49_006286 [Dermacentor silvarum]|uniref:Uncharacterized protein n=1 Tax=Dermacentor silvarum TaxID=543639 RepID=A0ACB8DWB9_DERSI|nr:hypothetical protein HPB49_006286 [Dermacentor silvarum]